jgi:hypothetical protein
MLLLPAGDCLRELSACRYSVFGRALVNAMRGGACKPHSKYVTALDIYTFVRAFVSKTVERYSALAQAEYRPESEQPAPVPVHQSPVLFVPQGHLEMASNPVCFKCEPPAAPEKPFVSTSAHIGVFFSLSDVVLPCWWYRSFELATTR